MSIRGFFRVASISSASHQSRRGRPWARPFRTVPLQVEFPLILVPTSFPPPALRALVLHASAGSTSAGRASGGAGSQQAGSAARRAKARQGWRERRSEKIGDTAGTIKARAFPARPAARHCGGQHGAVSTLGEFGPGQSQAHPSPRSSGPSKDGYATVWPHHGHCQPGIRAGVGAAAGQGQARATAWPGRCPAPSRLRPAQPYGMRH